MEGFHLVEFKSHKVEHDLKKGVSMETTTSNLGYRHTGFDAGQFTREIDIESHDGIMLHGWQVEAQGGMARGNIVIVHGMKDYSERYLDFARELSQAGYQIFGMDLRGLGRSGGDRNYFPHIEDNVDDLDRALKAFKEYDNNQPWIIFGHSAGGNIVARYAIDHQIAIDGFILSAPFLKPMPALNDFIIGALKAINLVAPHTNMVDLPDKDFSKDPKVVEDMINDPLINHTKIPARTGVEILNNCKYIEMNRSVVSIPFLVIHGEIDLVNNIEGTEEFYQNTQNIPGKQIRTYPGLYHDLLHEPEKKLITNDIISWINSMSNRH